MNFAKCKKLLITAGAAVILISSSELPLLAEAVFLKDGSIVEGNIVSDAAGSINIRTADKKTKQIPRGNIMRILYTELKLGKIYVQKRDGKGIVAHLVDEDRESYTFRKELYSPEEFQLKRNEVLFMAEKNPSGLQPDGEVETDRISLKWLPPYDPVKKYKLFIKKKQSDKYEPVDSTGSTSITIKNLGSNTEYFMIVTAIASAGNESDPSNELKFKTKNLPPDKPEGISRETKDNKVTVRWSESRDRDGKVKGYNIYRVDDKGKGKITAVKKPEYQVPDDISVYKLEITSEDDLGTESQKIRGFKPLQLAVSAAPSAFVFTGDLGEMFGPGYGGMFIIGLRNFVFQNFEAGLNGGYYMFKGKEEKNTDSMFMIPVTVYAGYHLCIGDWFSFFPFIKGGESYSLIKYTGLAGLTIASRGVCWSTSNNPTISDSKSVDGSGTGSFTSSITGLVKGGIIYYVRAYATSSTGITAYGDEVSLKTCGFSGPGGGLVFFDRGVYTTGDPNGDWRYMEAAPSDQGYYMWTISSLISTASGATGTAVGNGKANTIMIIAQVNDPLQTEYAAAKCTDYSNNGKSDWFLPSKEELHLVYTSLYQQGLLSGYGTNNYHYSSSESSANMAWLHGFSWGSGAQGPNDKDYNGYRRYVRAIRSY